MILGNSDFRRSLERALIAAAKKGTGADYLYQAKTFGQSELWGALYLGVQVQLEFRIVDMGYPAVLITQLDTRGPLRELKFEGVFEDTLGKIAYEEGNYTCLVRNFGRDFGYGTIEQMVGRGFTTKVDLPSHRGEGYYSLMMIREVIPRGAVFVSYDVGEEPEKKEEPTCPF